jgi:PBP/GOBP family
MCKNLLIRFSANLPTTNSKLINVLFLFPKASAEYIVKTRDDLTNARKQCIAQLEIPSTLVAEYQKRIFTADGATPCYIQCVFSQLGIFSTATGFNTDYYLAQLGKGDTFKAGVVGCYDNSGTDTCMWAYRAFTCFNKGGFLPEGY